MASSTANNDNDCAGSPKKQVAIVPPEPRLSECCGDGGGEGGGERQHLKNNKGEGEEEKV